MELERLTEAVSQALLPNTRRQGQKLLAQHAVTDISIDDRGHASATVHDTRADHRVEISSERHGVPSHSCTCTERFLCRHVAALHFALANPDRHTTGALRSQLVSGRMRAWLESLSEVEPAPEPRPDGTRVLYILRRPAIRDSVIDVRVVQARPKKRGGFGRPTGLSTTNVLRGAAAQCVTSLDQELIEHLALIGQASYSSEFKLGRRGSSLVLELVRTGRCFVDSLEHGPLEPAEARTAKPAWVADDTGDQSPRVEVEGGGDAYLFDHPLWIDGRSIGELSSPVEVDVLRKFAEGPGLTATTAAALAPDVFERFEELKLPAPSRFEVVESAAVPAQFGLVCYTKSIRTYYSGTMTIDAVHPFVRYGTTVVPLDSHEEWVVTRHDDRVERIQRDLPGEAVLLEQLRDLGLVELRETAVAARKSDIARELDAQGAALDMTFNAELGAADELAWQHFVEHDVPALRADGWDVQIDPDFRFAVMHAERVVANVSSQSGFDWFDIELGVEVGDGTRIDISPVLRTVLDRAARTKHDTVEAEVDGVRITIPTERLQRIATALIEFTSADSGRPNGRVRLANPQLATLGELEDCVDSLDWGDAEPVRELARRLANFDGVKPVPKPTNCKARMRTYQREGLAWLQFLREHDLCGILADDMGLGKTLQVLSHLLVEQASGRADRPSLVIAPTSVARNWIAEAERFAPSLKFALWHGPDRAQRHESLDRVDAIVTTYALALRDADTLGSRAYHLLVLDEAQAIKNSQSKVRRALRDIDARHRLCLTGTPLENNLSELWSQFDFLMPGLLGNAREFGRTFRTPIERRDDDDARTALQRRIRPFVLRRTKDKVLRQLPPKTEITHTIELGAKQRDLYESIRVAMQERVQQAIDESGINRAQIVILDALLKLRQVCCDPALVKLAAARKVQESAKLEELMELLPRLIADGRRVLLFSQFTSMLTRIEARLRKAKIEFVKLTGSTRDREAPIQKFQTGQVPVFLISLKAGGTGLNLTAADAVIHYDPWWNPAVERQATDRAHRIGQRKPVFVYRMITAESVEEKIAQLQERKRKLFEGVVEAGAGKAGAKLTRKDVEMLFG